MVGNLTVAKQQMVEISKALSFDSKVLIMDEPTAALTDTEIDALFVMIRKLREDGVGIVYISHRMEEPKENYGPCIDYARRYICRNDAYKGCND